MNAILFGAAASERTGMISDQPKSDPSSDVAWMVLEAANDRRSKHVAGSSCEPGHLRHRLHVVSDYFR
jgi:hypothetical protein